jgi:N-acetylglucosaminyl-diphospho-decaprenol L-rhamnosyltransferase
MTTPRLSAVVVAWNAGATLAACVDSLRESARRTNEPLQTVVVDNGSSDGAVDDLRLEASDVVVRNPLNAGYGVAAAQGIARAAAPWILLVNPDLTVHPAFVGALLAAADAAEPAVATLVPEMRFASRPELVNCRGVTVDEIGVPAEIDAGIAAVEGADPSTSVLGGSSGCCLLRAEHVRMLGGPEPAFFAYLEDVDLALRLCCAGYETTFVPSAIAFHEGSASTGARSPLKVFLVARNRRLLFRLHGPRSVRATAWRALVDLAHGAYSSLATPVAPWAGRLEALRFRRYVQFLRRSRTAETCVGNYPRPPRATLRETLSRKQRIVRRDG